MIKICDTCKKEFEAYTRRSHTCKECQQKKNSLRLKVKEDVKKTKSLDGLKELIDAGIYDDFEEIPVSFEEFITNREYLGNSWLDSSGNIKAFPFWVEQGKKIFPLPMRSPYHTILLEGGTGLGKTSFAVNMVIAYYLYIVLCIRDVHEYFDLADQKKITFAFLNIVTKTIAYKNAWGMLHKALLSSPWFMKHGAATEGRMPEWYCTDKPVDLLFGSSPNDVIGLDILCLTGDTEVLMSDKTWKSLESLEDSKIRVYSYNKNNKTSVLSDVCEVQKTKETKNLIELELEDGTVVKCTPEHRFLLKTGEYKLVKDLTLEDEIEEGE